MFSEDQIEKIQTISREEVVKMITSPVYLFLVTCVASLAGFIIINSYQTLTKVSDSVNRLETSISLLNSSLNVMDERTKRSEEAIIEIYKGK